MIYEREHEIWPSSLRFMYLLRSGGWKNLYGVYIHITKIPLDVY
jgi:hypothetical protein